MSIPSHPLAELFPLIKGAEFDALVDDVRINGIRDPIIILDGQILDGRNRYRALEALIETGEVLGDGWLHRKGEALTPSALEPPQLWFHRYNEKLDGEPLAWVISKNLKRRHLDESQRAMVAAKLANLGVGRPKSFEPAPDYSPSIEGISAKASAGLLNVGRASVERAKVVLRDGVEALRDAVEQGRVAVSAAEAIARAAPDEQAQIIDAAAGDEKQILAAAKAIRSRERKALFDRVNERLVTVSEQSRPLPTGQKFPIIYADPATRFVSGFGDRSIENHYPTMTVDEICALPVSELALPDAALFIWTTIPQLRNTMQFIEVWGFKYVSAWCWDKVDPGSGYWGFNQHEELLIAKRGKFPAPVPGTQPRSIYTEKKTEHSRKPDWFAEQIERIYPSLPKIELFARSARPGWAVLRGLIDEIEAVRERKKQIAEQEKEIFQRGKARGFDVKTIRAVLAIRKSGTSEWQEAATLLDTYMHAIGMGEEPPLFMALSRVSADMAARDEAVEFMKTIVPPLGEIVLKLGGVPIRVYRDADGKAQAEEVVEPPPSVKELSAMGGGHGSLPH